MDENKETRRELTETEAEKVTGGEFNTTIYWKKEDEVEFIYEIGDEVEVASGWGFGTTVRCGITDRKANFFRPTTVGPLGTPIVYGYRDEYFCEALDPPFYFIGDKSWRFRSEIEK